jgi:hypothetical protein
MVKCDICIRDVGKWRKYCSRCRRFVYRAGQKAAHVAALKRDYDKEKDVFRCHYTRIILEENDRHSPRYLTFDHLVPGVKGKDNQVITFAVLNEQKTDLGYDEYVAFCRQVVRNHDTGGFDERVLELKHWFRLVRPQGARRAVDRASR